MAGFTGHGDELLDGAEDFVPEQEPDHVHAALRPGTRVRRRLVARHVLPGEHPLSKRREDNLVDAFLGAEGSYFGLDDSPQHRILWLTGDDQIQAHLICYP